MLDALFRVTRAIKRKFSPEYLEEHKLNPLSCFGIISDRKPLNAVTCIFTSCVFRTHVPLENPKVLNREFFSDRVFGPIEKYITLRTAPFYTCLEMSTLSDVEDDLECLSTLATFLDVAAKNNFPDINPVVGYIIECIRQIAYETA